MSEPKSLFGVFRPRTDAPDLAAAQVKALANRLTLLHASLNIGAVGVAFVYYGVAPHLLTLGPVALLIVVSGTRVVSTARSAGRPADREAVRRRLRMIDLCALAMSAAFVAWGVALAQYGGTSLKLYALFFNTTSIIACVFCLAHLRSAALIVAASAVPIALAFAFGGDTVLVAMAVNLLAITAIMVTMLFVYYDDFAKLVQQRSELERLSDENARLAHLDTLTGLPNRRRYFARLDDRIAAGGRTAFTVGMIDLDGFKPVNDTYGHQAGDAVLCEAGARLQRTLDGSGWVARLGGDEFGIIIDGPVDAPGTAAIGQAIREALRAPYALGTGTAQIDASIGLAGFPEAGAEPILLCERAAYALHHAKANRSGGVAVFTREHETRLRSRGVMEQTLRHADLETEFALVYQPIVDTGLATVTAFEALARWTSPRLGPVSPVDFIDVAERSGLVQGLTMVLLAKALDAAAGWPDEVRLSFNLSTFDLASPESVARIADIIAAGRVAPARIIFEVTETALMRDFGQAKQGLTTLKALGVAIALDDFGTGYSSLSYVHRLPIDRLKIDRSFTSELEHDQGCRDIVQSVVNLCRNLEIDCVVEGVETLEQMLLLRTLGCQIMQGYLLHQPMTRDEVGPFLSTGTTVGMILARDEMSSAA